MTKNEAIKRYGQAVVERAREIYETDFGKVLFEEDADYEDIPADEETQLDRIGRAIVSLANPPKPIVPQRTIWGYLNDLRSEVLQHTPSGSDTVAVNDAFNDFEIHLRKHFQ